MRIKNLDLLNGHGNIEGRKIITDLLEAGMQAADPYYNAKDLVKVEGNKIFIGNPDFEPVGSPRKGLDIYEFGKDIDRIFIYGAGKGIWRAIEAIEETLGDFLCGGHIVLKHGDNANSKKLGITEAGHPVPDQYGVEGCRAMLASIKEAKLTERDLVITVIGNGVSALLTMPPEGVDLEDVMEITRIIQIERGFETAKLNRVRNQVDQLKGGRITRLLRPAKMVHVVTIDVNFKNNYNLQGYRALTETNTWLHTLPDMTSAEDAIQFLKENDIWDYMPKSIQTYLTVDYVKYPVLKKDEFEKMDCRIFGLMPKTRSVVPAILSRAKTLGYEPHWMAKQFFEDAKAVSNLACSVAKLIQDEGSPFKAPCVLLFTGEMLVSVGNNKESIGGRNQEFCMHAAVAIDGNKRIVAGSVDTDGTDGPGGRFNEEAWDLGCNNLTGGVVDGCTMKAAREKEIDFPALLRRHDNSDALWRLNSGIWATQNISVNDITMLLVMDHDGC